MPGSIDEKRILRSLRIGKGPSAVKEVVRQLDAGVKDYSIRKTTGLAKPTIKNIRGLWEQGALNPLLAQWGFTPVEVASRWRAQLRQALSKIPYPKAAFSLDLSQAFGPLLSLRIPEGVQGLTSEEMANFRLLQERIGEYQANLEKLQRMPADAQKELGWPTNPVFGQAGLLPEFGDSISQDLLWCCGDFETAPCCGGHVPLRASYRRTPTTRKGYFVLLFECHKKWEISLGNNRKLQRCETLHRRVFADCASLANEALRLYQEVVFIRDLLGLPQTRS